MIYETLQYQSKLWNKNTVMFIIVSEILKLMISPDWIDMNRAIAVSRSIVAVYSFLLSLQAPDTHWARLNRMLINKPTITNS